MNLLIAPKSMLFAKMMKNVGHYGLMTQIQLQLILMRHYKTILCLLNFMIVIGGIKKITIVWEKSIYVN